MLDVKGDSFYSSHYDEQIKQSSQDKVQQPVQHVNQPEQSIQHSIPTPQQNIQKKTEPIINPQPTQIAEKKLHPNPLRVAFPELVKVLGISCIFFVLIIVNSKLIGFELPIFVYVLFVVVLFILSIAQTIITANKQPVYMFTKDKMMSTKRSEWEYSYSSIESLGVKKNLLDNIFSTGTIVVNNSSLQIKDIKNPEKIINYINHLRSQNSSTK